MMESAYRFPSSPGQPLFPISPERVNRQQLPQSPSCPSELSRILHDPLISPSIHRNSDVQGKVAQFNNLNKEAAQRRKDNEAALKRAVVGREEAESETRRLRDERRVLRQELEEGRAKERKVGQRVEAVMEEMQRMQETQAHSQALYEKEVRRARKEAFKASSSLVKLQEELKATRNKYTLMREDAEVQRRKAANREEETFAAQYQLVGVQEELENVKQQIKNVQEERDALKTSLKEEEVARVAAEGKILLPASEVTDEFSSPKKSRPRRESAKENIDPLSSFTHDENQVTSLQQQLRRERKLRTRADEMIDFMKTECQFLTCSCRRAEEQGTVYIHDHQFALETARVEQETSFTATPQLLTPPTTESQLEDTEPLIEFSPTTGTFRTIASPAKHQTPNSSPLPAPPTSTLAPPLLPTSPSESPSLLALPSPPHLAAPIPITPLPIRLVTKTTTVTIPLASASPATPSTAFPYSPGCTMTREQALEQIRMRRGRARSVAITEGTPRRAEAIKRDISAPVRKGKGV